MEFSLIQIFAFVIVGFFATSYGVLVGAGGGFIIGPILLPVSYTHLTLPTIYSV